MIQKSQIVLFAGDFVPFGFAKCDGKNGTPNLPPLVYNKDADPLPYLIATVDIDDYYVGMILLTGFNNQSGYNFPPMDWLPCDGRLLELTKHIILFQILKTTFGGEGMQFALPNIAVAKATSGYNAAPYIICTQGPFPSPS